MVRKVISRFHHWIQFTRRELAKKVVRLESANNTLKKNNSNLRKEIEFLHLTIQMDQMDMSNDLDGLGDDDDYEDR